MPRSQMPPKQLAGHKKEAEMVDKVPKFDIIVGIVNLFKGGFIAR